MKNWRERVAKLHTKEFNSEVLEGDVSIRLLTVKEATLIAEKSDKDIGGVNRMVASYIARELKWVETGEKVFDGDAKDEVDFLLEHPLLFKELSNSIQESLSGIDPELPKT